MSTDTPETLSDARESQEHGETVAPMTTDGMTLEASRIK